MNSEKKLKVSEIKESIHGEMPKQGIPVLLLRLYGCNEKCTFCDVSPSVNKSFKAMSLRSILTEVKRKSFKEILVTGGEPLCQESCVDLVKLLLKNNFNVTLETNGTFSIGKVPRKTTIVMDVKTPSSGAVQNTLFSNLKYLGKKDVLKFVISGKKDYLFAKNIIRKYSKTVSAEVVFSPVYGKLKAKDLAAMLIKDRSFMRMQIQLHKYLKLP